MTLNIKLHPERLVQPHSGELGGAVVHQLVGAAVTRQAGDIDKVSLAIKHYMHLLIEMEPRLCGDKSFAIYNSDLLVADHVGEESLDRPEVCHDVYVKCTDNLLVRGVKQGGPGDDPGIVHEDGHWTNLTLGLLSHLVNVLPLNYDNHTLLSQ